MGTHAWLQLARDMQHALPASVCHWPSQITKMVAQAAEPYIFYCVANVMAFLVDNGQPANLPHLDQDPAKTKHVIAGRIGLAGRQKRVDSQGACGHVAMPHLTPLITRRMHSQEMLEHIVYPAQNLSCKASPIS